MYVFGDESNAIQLKCHITTVREGEAPYASHSRRRSNPIPKLADIVVYDDDQIFEFAYSAHRLSIRLGDCHRASALMATTQCTDAIFYLYIEAVRLAKCQLAEERPHCAMPVT